MSDIDRALDVAILTPLARVAYRWRQRFGRELLHSHELINWLVVEHGLEHSEAKRRTLAEIAELLTRQSIRQLNRDDLTEPEQTVYDGMPRDGIWLTAEQISKLSGYSVARVRKLLAPPKSLRRLGFVELNRTNGRGYRRVGEDRTNT